MHSFETEMSVNWDSLTSLTSDPLNRLPIWQKYYNYSNDLYTFLSKMDDSDDVRKRKSNLLHDWTNNPFERVNHSTNFEDYACSSDDTNFLYGSSDDHKTNAIKTLNANQIKDSVSNSFPKLKTKSIVSTVPSITTHLTDQRDGSFVESCLSAGNSSADVTPSGTPQSSPYSIRKAMDVKMANNNHNKKVSSNQKRWFYTGFFNSEAKTGIDDKTIGQLPKNPSFKNLCVSNFDINAVGPTSW